VAASLAEVSLGELSLAEYMELSRFAMDASPWRGCQTTKDAKTPSEAVFAQRKAAMQKMIDEVFALRAHLGHVNARGFLTLMLTGTFRGEAEFSLAKTDNPDPGGRKRKRSASARKKTHIKDFFRRIEMIFKRRELDRSTKADKAASRPVQDVHSEQSRELERVSVEAIASNVLTHS